MRLAVVLLWHVWLKILRAGPLDLPQLTSECRATYRVRQVTWFFGRVHVNSALVRLTSRFSLALDASTSVFLLSIVKNLALIATSSWIRRCGGVAVEVGESAILAFGVESAWWLHPHRFRRHRLVPGNPAAAVMYSDTAECRRWRSR